MAIGTAFSAVVLAGGVAARLDGADKASIELHGRTLLTWALDAVMDAAEVVVVGDPVPTHRPVTFTREDPRHGGPVAALLTGRDALLDPRGTVAVLACDMPFLTARSFQRLRDSVAGSSPWCSTWAAWTPCDRASRSSTTWRCTGCSHRSTSSRCPPKGANTAMWTPGRTSGT
jgi:molybdopterin-guanine dinucleotide biosynthesis protein A